MISNAGLTHAMTNLSVILMVERKFQVINNYLT
jgi:hypothetical protein